LEGLASGAKLLAGPHHEGVSTLKRVALALEARPMDHGDSPAALESLAVPSSPTGKSATSPPDTHGGPLLEHLLLLPLHGLGIHLLLQVELRIHQEGTALSVCDGGAAAHHQKGSQHRNQIQAFHWAMP
jgi:hypothetical protein